MTVIDFLLHHTQCYELCVITNRGWIVATAWIDDEDIFRIASTVAELIVDREYWGYLDTTLENGAKSKIRVHYIDAHSEEKK